MQHPQRVCAGNSTCISSILEHDGHHCILWLASKLPREGLEH